MNTISIIITTFSVIYLLSVNSVLYKEINSLKELNNALRSYAHTADKVIAKLENEREERNV